MKIGHPLRGLLLCLVASWPACTDLPAPRPAVAPPPAPLSEAAPVAAPRSRPSPPVLTPTLQPVAAHIRLVSLAPATPARGAEADRRSGGRASRPRPELLERCNAPRSVVVHKAARRLELYCGSQLAARYTVGLGFSPRGDKHHEGDGRTPQGRYFITGKFPSRFHRSLQLSYPNAEDAARGLAEGQITRRQHDAIVRALRACRRPPQNTALGSLLQIHGGGGGGDWTLGCVALDDPAIEHLYAFQQPGCLTDGTPRTPVDILP